MDLLPPPHTHTLWSPEYKFTALNCDFSKVQTQGLQIIIIIIITILKMH